MQQLDGGETEQPGEQSIYAIYEHLKAEKDPSDDQMTDDELLSNDDFFDQLILINRGIALLG